ncbi:hypothetical protein COO60DRAFT_1553503 [Scenedesmus sp. NREL 46B-D3]|nr:hypothetical protein COO60DRAFT_1553503 [Scenedesmus sp. NREL 46B-D3]
MMLGMHPECLQASTWQRCARRLVTAALPRLCQHLQQDAALATRKGDGDLHIRVGQQSVPVSSTPHAHACRCVLLCSLHGCRASPAAAAVCVAYTWLYVGWWHKAQRLLAVSCSTRALLLLQCSCPLARMSQPAASPPGFLSPAHLNRQAAGSRTALPLLPREPCPACHSSSRLGGLLPCHTLPKGPAGAATACHAGRCCGGQHRCRRWRFANPGFLPARRSATCVSSWICSLISSCSW